MQKDLTPEALEENKNVIDSVIHSYISGSTIKEVAEFHKITYYQVRRILVENNIRIRNKNERL